jgi:hypothetical protein
MEEGEERSEAGFVRRHKRTWRDLEGALGGERGIGSNVSATLREGDRGIGRAGSGTHTYSVCWLSIGSQLRCNHTVGTNKTPIVNQRPSTWPTMRSTLAMGQPGRAKAQKASAGEGQGDVGLSGLLILIYRFFDLIVVQVTVDISIFGHLARNDQNTQAMAYVL